MFGHFSLFYELFAKFTEIDGTSHMETNYHPLGTGKEEDKPGTKDTLKVEEVDGTKIQLYPEDTPVVDR